MIKTNEVSSWVALIGGFLATIISLSIILGWSTENKVNTKAAEIKKEKLDKR